VIAKWDPKSEYGSITDVVKIEAVDPGWIVSTVARHRANRTAAGEWGDTPSPDEDHEQFLRAVGAEDEDPLDVAGATRTGDEGEHARE
jgi:hypothetical protein